MKKSLLLSMVLIGSLLFPNLVGAIPLGGSGDFDNVSVTHYFGNPNAMALIGQPFDPDTVVGATGVFEWEIPGFLTETNGFDINRIKIAVVTGGIGLNALYNLYLDGKPLDGSLNSDREVYSLREFDLSAFPFWQEEIGKNLDTLTFRIEPIIFGGRLTDEFFVPFSAVTLEGTRTVPEPGTIILFGLGTIAFSGMVRRSRRHKR